MYLWAAVDWDKYFLCFGIKRGDFVLYLLKCYKLVVMVVVYEKRRQIFRIFRDKKDVESLGVDKKVLLAAMQETHETDEYIIGKGRYIKSKRGGNRQSP